MKPIFMIGTQRSGSNLLRLMLNQLPEVASPHPPHVLQRIYPLLDRYGDLSNMDNFRVLVDDVCRLVELNPVPWEGVKLDREDVASRCRENSLVAVFGAVYDLFAEARGAKTWCCKSLANIQYGDEIERYFDQPKFLYLYRDGRDAAVSFHKAVVGEKHYYHIAKHWAETQMLAIELRGKIPADRFMMVSYEELTGEPQATGKRLCEFLGVAYTDAMLDFHKSDEAKRAASSSKLWNNVVSPVMKDNTRKFLREATTEQIAVFESVAGTVLDELGYERSVVPIGEEKTFSSEEIAAFDEENRRLKAAIWEQIDAEDVKRRERQEGLIEEIRGRQAA